MANLDTKGETKSLERFLKELKDRVSVTFRLDVRIAEVVIVARLPIRTVGLVNERLALLCGPAQSISAHVAELLGQPFFVVERLHV